VRYRTPDRRQTDKRGFRTKREAEDFLASVEVSKLRGEWVDASRSRITIADWAPRWYESQLQLKETTLSGYRHSLEKHVVPKWGNHRLVDISYSDVQSWATQLSKKLAPSTVRQVFLVLSNMLK
jgi:hypothetical protein